MEVETERTLRSPNVSRLSSLGIDMTQYGSFDYTATQAIAAAAHFLECDGLIVPSARHTSLNLVLFLDRITPGNRLELRETQEVDWASWRMNRARP